MTVNTGRGTGSLHLDVVDGASIRNAAFTPLAGTPFAGEIYQIDKGGTVVGTGEGQPVTDFGSSGYALFSNLPYANVTSTTAVLADGRILGAGAVGCTNFIPGDVNSPLVCTLQVARYLEDGALDDSFGTHGRVVAAVTQTGAEVDDIIVNGDGTILVASVRYDGTNWVPFVAKFTSEGAPDGSFNATGVKVLDTLFLQGGLIGFAVDGSGRSVIVGTTPVVGPDSGNILVARLTSAGALDSTFGSNGVAQFAISGAGDLRDRGSAVAVQPDGKIVVGGNTRVALNNTIDFLVLRLDGAGAPDDSFGTHGVVTTRFPASTGGNSGRKLVLQPDGKIVLAGPVNVGGVNKCGIARFDASGALDFGFGTGGQVLASITSCTNVSLQPDGKLVVVGGDASTGVWYAQFARLLQTGAPDNGFGTAGYLAISSFDYPPARVSFTSGGNLVTMLKIQDPADGSVQKSYVVELSGTLAGPWVAQSITFNPLSAKTIGDPDFAVSASASSGLPVSFGASGACTVVGNLVHLTGTGSCTISADQGGDATYNAAAQVIRTFAIGAAATPPTVVSLVRAVPSPTMADTVTYTLTFSEPVTGVASNNFQIVTSAIAAPSITGVNPEIIGGGTTWTVTVSTGRGTGTLRLDVVDGASIKNAALTPLAGTPFAGETYLIDKGGTVIGTGQGQPVAGTGFGTGGYAPFSEGQGTATPGRLRVLSDGKILVAGGIGCAALVPSDPSSPYYCTLQLARYLVTGGVDTTFGTNGRIVTAVTMVNPEVNLSRVNSDGTFFVSGIRHFGTDDVPFAAKFTSTGAPDTSYGAGGVVTLTSLPLGWGIVGSGTDGTGLVVIVGTTLDPGTGERQDIFVTRLTSTGATDTTFGTGGVAQFALSNVDNRSDVGTTFDVQPDGKIVLGGRTKVTSGSGYDFLLMRLEANGARDTTFGANGVATTRFPPTSTSNNLGRRLVLQPDGKIVLVGTVTGGTANQCGIARFTANGTLDPDFGTGGQVLVPMSVGCFNVSQQSDGKLVIVGNDKVGDVTYGTFARLLLTGALDTGFGNGGLLKISNFDTPTRVAFTSGGNIVTGLTIQDPADGVQKSYVVELTSTLTGPWVSQTIPLGALPGRAYGETFQLPATASSGLTVSYSASGACSVAGNFVQPNGVGTCTITANQAGSATYFAAPQQVQAFAVTSASQGITFGPAPVGVTVGQPLVTVVATSSSATSPPSALPITFSSLTPSVCTTGGINGADLTLLQAGQCTIQATQAGDANYVAATQTQSFAVGVAGAAPNTYAVVNLNDVPPGSPGSAGSLRDAIAQANASPGPDIIDLSGVSGTIVLTQGSILIAGPTVIVGPGADVLTIDGNAGNRIFSIGATFPACPALDGPNDYLVSIAGLRLANGRRNVADSSGGAIYTEHSLALDSMVIENSVARAGGGVMFSIQYPGQSLTIANSRFLNNVATEVVPATPSATANSSGGGLYIVEKCQNAFDTPYTTPVSVTIAGSEFRGNSAQPLAIHGRGGAIRSYSRADIVIVDTSIVDNHVDAPNPPTPGRVYHGGAFEGSAKSLRIERSEIAENTANAIPSSDAVRSGGLHIYNSAVDLQGPGDRIAVKFVNSTISGNASTATAGAMAAFGNMALELSNSTVSDNEAAPNRTGGILVSSGDTYPVSGSNTSASDAQAHFVHPGQQPHGK